MTTRKILWADDEIDMLRPHILYLQSKGFSVAAVSNGEDALASLAREPYDIVLLDEMMPGMGGLATLEQLHEKHPAVPVIMITKSEEENLMNLAIGRQIEDYLTKPVNPSQIFLAIKKVFESELLQRRQKTRDYVAEFREIVSMRHGDLNWQDWLDLFGRATAWDLELRGIEDQSLAMAHQDQRAQLNREFGRYIEQQYPRWVKAPRADRPPLSIDILPEWVIPHAKQGRRVAVVVIDCMRLDQWLVLVPLLKPYFDIKTDLYYSILPTATPYSRNAIWSGLYPLEIQTRHPQWWLPADEKESGRNRHEKDLMAELLRRHGVDAESSRFTKVYTAMEGNNLRKRIGTLGEIRFLGFVFNFLDMLAHGRAESEILQELAPDEEALRGLLSSWFQHSVLFEVLRVLSRQDTVVVVTTDHGAVMAKRSSTVLANRETSTSVRYKFGDNLVCDEKEAFHIKDPEAMMLPRDRLLTHYILAKENYYFVYPTNFHKYERQYRGSFQHGGVSLEEMVLPVATLMPRGVS
ncbi:MAG: response regulator [Candidatus Eisenbacteria bacterium]|nr:response regulator [Candidatus Eisenbacteria bacterium]